MQVENILQSKGAAVHTITSRARVSDAVKALNAHRIGAIVVVDAGGEVAGIVSERDVVRKMGDDPTAFLELPVSEIMTRSVVTCRRSDSIALVMERMTEHRVRHIPICEDGELVGIVSIGDVVKRKIEEAEFEASALRDYIAT